MVDSITTISNRYDMERVVKILEDVVVCTRVAQQVLQQELTGCTELAQLSKLLITFGALTVLQGCAETALVAARQ